ncbi:MAG: hypothetical protein R3C15_01050 [Thermoleophilia bacterium]
MSLNVRLTTVEETIVEFGTKTRRSSSVRSTVVDERDLLDLARRVADEDPVADPHRLRQRQQDAGAQVRERRREGEAHEQRQHRAGRQHRGRELLGLETRPACSDDDHDQHGDDHAPQHAEPRPHAGDLVRRAPRRLRGAPSARSPSGSGASGRPGCRRHPRRR